MCIIMHKKREEEEGREGGGEEGEEEIERKRERGSIPGTIISIKFMGMYKCLCVCTG